MSEGSIRERLAALSHGELVGLVALLGVTLGGAGLWYVRSLPRPVEVSTAPSGGGASAPTLASPSPEIVVLVDVAGWVREPGVYEFTEGARVIDAIDAAGGARPGALLQALNLAAPLADGTQVLVPRERQEGVAPPTVSGGAVAGGLVNVNTATAIELEELPGIGEVIAQAIVDYRTQNGPFASVDQLLDVSGIGDATLEDIRDLVSV
jgi:competence protein ComEA